MTPAKLPSTRRGTPKPSASSAAAPTPGVTARSAKTPAKAPSSSKPSAKAVAKPSPKSTTGKRAPMATPKPTPKSTTKAATTSSAPTPRAEPRAATPARRSATTPAAAPKASTSVKAAGGRPRRPARVEQVELFPVPTPPVPAPRAPRAPRPEIVEPAALPDEATIAALIKESERAIRVQPPGASSSFAMYLHELQRYPVLTAEQEHRFAVLARAGSEEAQKALINHNLRFVITIARKHASHGLAIEDLVQEGNIGLMRAVTKFNPDRGVKFVSYAVHWIQQSMRSGLASQQRSVRLPINRATQLAKINRTIHQLTKVYGRPPSQQEIAVAADIPLPTVETLLTVSQTDLSLDAPRPGDDEGGMVLSERIGEENPFESRIERRCRNDVIATVLGRLRPRDAQVLRLCYGIDGGREHTLEEIGLILGVTRERIRQIRDRALRDVKAMDEVELLRDYWGVSFPEG